jgi:Uma2 family endonuclease
MEEQRREQRGDRDIMAVMHAPRTRHTDPPPQQPEQAAQREQAAQPEQVAQPEQAAQPEPVVPASTVDEPDDPRLWALYQDLDISQLGHGGFRVEFIEGTIVVRGATTIWHERAVMWLVEHLLETTKARGWEMAAKGTLPDLPGPARTIMPDLVIYDPGPEPPEDWDGLPPSQMRLVAEVVSRGSTEADRTLKPLSCARAGVSLYLCVDRFVTPVTVTVMSTPSPDGYQQVTTAAAGPGTGKLALPDPFGIVLDLATLPVP